MREVLYYGKLNDKIVSINDVVKGLKCNCVCPSCGGQLIAKKGSKKIHHFAHQSLQTCEYGYETSLHLLAKDLILNSKKFYLPEVSLIIDGKATTLENGKLINIEHVKCEVSLDNVKPDLIIESDGLKYFIEIYVTHKVDEIKLEKLKTKNIPTLEINLSKINTNISPKDLENIIFSETDNRKYWVFNPIIQQKQDEISEHYQELKRIKTEKYGLPINEHLEPLQCPIGNNKAYFDHWGKLVKGHRCCFDCEHFLGYDDDVVYCDQKNQIQHRKTPQKHLCPHCNKTLVLRKGKKGLFWACPSYPNCFYTINISCPLCSSPLLKKQYNSKYFIGCANYPNCKYSANFYEYEKH